MAEIDQPPSTMRVLGLRRARGSFREQKRPGGRDDSAALLFRAPWVNETSFWKPEEKRRADFVRSNRVQDREDGLSEFPHAILHHARAHEFYLDVMRVAQSRLEPEYSRRFGLSVAAASGDGEQDGENGPSAH